MSGEPLACLDAGADPSGCSGQVEPRWPMSPSGRWFPRCERHFELRLAEQARISASYGVPMFYDGGEPDYEDEDGE